MIDFTKLIRKDYPEYDPNRHYYTNGDVVIFNDDYIVMSIDSGFRYLTGVVIKGFNKGKSVKISNQDTPYISREDYDKSESINICRSLYRKKILYSVGDIIIDNGFLGCVLKVSDDKRYYDSVLIIDQSNSDCTYDYVDTKVSIPNKYADYFTN